MKWSARLLFWLFLVGAAQAQGQFLANDGTFKLPIVGGVTISGPAVSGTIPIATSTSAAAWSPLFTVPNTWTALQTFTAGVISGANGGVGGFITLNGATSGSSTITVTAAGGTLNFGSTAATVSLTGAMSATPSLTLNGTTSGAAVLSVAATGGTLNLGSANATVTAAGAISAATSFTAGVNGGTGGSLVLNGATSGALTQVVPAAAGTPTATWGSSSGTPAVTASAPLAITAATGNVTCATCATTTNGGALSGVAPVALSAGGAISITGVAGQVLAGSGPAFTASPTLGVNGGAAGQLTINGSAAGPNNKVIRVGGSVTNNLEIVNAGNTAVILSLTDGGQLNVNGTLVSGAAGIGTGILQLTGTTSGAATVSGSATGGHISYTSSSTPTNNACAGFSLTSGSTDIAGRVTFTSATSCAINFGTAYANAPFCNVTPGTAATPSTVDVTTTTAVLTANFTTAQTSMMYQCFGA